MSTTTFSLVFSTLTTLALAGPAAGQIVASGFAGVTDAASGVPFTLDFSDTAGGAPFDPVGLSFVLTGPSFTSVDVQFDGGEAFNFLPVATLAESADTAGFFLTAAVADGVQSDLPPLPFPDALAAALSDGIVDVRLTLQGNTVDGPITFSSSAQFVVPEPTSFALLGVSAVGLLRRPRRWVFRA